MESSGKFCYKCALVCPQEDFDEEETCTVNDPEEFRQKYNGLCPAGVEPKWVKEPIY